MPVTSLKEWDCQSRSLCLPLTPTTFLHVLSMPVTTRAVKFTPPSRLRWTSRMRAIWSVISFICSMKIPSSLASAMQQFAETGQLSFTEEQISEIVRLSCRLQWITIRRWQPFVISRIPPAIFSIRTPPPASRPAKIYPVVNIRLSAWRQPTRPNSPMLLTRQPVETRSVQPALMAWRTVSDVARLFMPRRMLLDYLAENAL